MASTTPSAQRNRSASRSRAQTPPPRPTTPLRAPSRSSLRSSHTPLHGAASTSDHPLSSLEGPFGELADSMADLEANFVHLQLMHESLARFSECFASFLYGLNVNAFCVDFPEAPVPESFRRARDNPLFAQQSATGQLGSYGNPDMPDMALDVDQTFLTTDTSFVENPPASSVKTPSTATSRFSTPRASRAAAASRGGGTATRGARGVTTTSTRATTGTRGRASGLARASTTGRGVTR